MAITQRELLTALKDRHAVGIESLNQAGRREFSESLNDLVTGQYMSTEYSKWVHPYERFTLYSARKSAEEEFENGCVYLERPLKRQNEPILIRWDSDLLVVSGTEQFKFNSDLETAIADSLVQRVHQDLNIVPEKSIDAVRFGYGSIPLNYSANPISTVSSFYAICDDKKLKIDNAMGYVGILQHVFEDAIKGLGSKVANAAYKSAFSNISMAHAIGKQ